MLVRVSKLSSTDNGSARPDYNCVRISVAEIAVSVEGWGTWFVFNPVSSPGGEVSSK